MKNLITYLKTLWSRVADSQRKEVGVISGEATIEHPFSTYSAPFGTCWQPSGKLHSVVRCAAMLVMLLTLGSGNVWGETMELTFEGSGTFPNNSAWTVNSGSQNTTYNHTASGSKSCQFSATGFYIKTNEKIAGTITNIKYYATKASTNTTSTNVYIQTSTDGSNWTTVNTFNIASTTKGTFTEVSQNLTNNNVNVYVRISRGGSSTANRIIDDIIITYTVAEPKYTLKVPDGEGGYVTYSNKVKADLTEDMAVSGHSCPGDLDGTYSGWRVGALETPAASPGTTYNSSTAGAMPSDGGTLYAVFRQTSGSYYYLTNPSCAAAKTLSSIAITMQPTTTKYLVGETFSKTGAVVTATYSDATTANVSASTSWTPTTVLVAGSNTITASYTEGGITKTATSTVTAYSVTVQKKDEDGTTIADAGVTASASGRTLTASAGSTHYVFKTWKYGTASGTSIASATSASTSLTGTPSAAVTVIAEFYKPCTVTWSVNGSTYQTTSNVSYNTTTSTPANPSVPGECTGSTFMGWTSNSGWASDSAPGDLFNGTSPTITGNITFYAVFADEK